ncbi:MAG: IS200/IS605 family transposase [Cyanobacteria bacterium P01_B01_bin.77]
MPYWQLFYHLVWATKNREPLITTVREDLLYRDIRSRANRLGCIPYAIGGTENHIHVILTIPPSLSISDVVKQLKGGSSRMLNQQNSVSPDKFKWQTEYSVFSLGRKQLDKAIRYVQHQKEHHAVGSIIKALELTRPIE